MVVILCVYCEQKNDKEQIVRNLTILYVCDMEFNENINVAKMGILMNTIRDIRDMTRNRFMKKMKEHNIDVTIEMLTVFYILWEKDGINQQEIVDKTGKSKATITSLIDNMATRGFVERIASPTDRRSNLVALTEYGKVCQLSLIPLLEEVYQESFSNVVSGDELDSTITILKAIQKNMKE